jgi:TolA-binding protein
MLIYTACVHVVEKKDNKKVLLEEIAQREAVLFDTTQKKFNSSEAIALTKAYEAYALDYAQDSLTPELLFKAAELYSALRQSYKALETYKQIYADYPQFEKRPICLFMQAYITDDELNDDNQAKILYEKFIAEFPNHVLAKDAKFSIENLGLTDEELLRKFQQQNQKVNS